MNLTTTIHDPHNKTYGVVLSQERVQELFEKQFGTNKETRTRSQWKALVKQYGMTTVMKQDGMTEKEVKAKIKNAPVV